MINEAQTGTNTQLGTAAYAAKDASGNPNQNTAIGANAQASGGKATALGSGAVATAENSVALGAGSIADRANTVSVASQGNERIISNVADGVLDTDAANMGQVRDIERRLNSKVDKVDRNLRAGIAGVTAIAHIPQVTQAGESMIGAGVGHYMGQSAVAVGYSRMTNNGSVILKFSGSAATNGTYNVGAGVGYRW